MVDPWGSAAGLVIFLAVVVGAFVYVELTRKTTEGNEGEPKK